jgi:type VI secretion system protein ImpJ
MERLASKSSSLSAPRRQEGRGLSNLTASEVYNFWLLHTVNSYLPVLKHIWTVRRGHPESLFVSMLHLAGALSTFSPDVDPADFPNYDHEDLGSCFSALDAKMETLLHQLFKENFISVELQLSDKSIWSGTIREDQHLKNSQFYLAMSAQIGVDDLIKRVPQLVKIAATNEIQRVIRVALPGVTLRHVSSPPSAIPLKLDNQYFILNQGGVLWEGITASRSVSVYIPSDIVSPRPELLIVLNEGG